MKLLIGTSLLLMNTAMAASTTYVGENHTGLARWEATVETSETDGSFLTLRYFENTSANRLCIPTNIGLSALKANVVFVVGKDTDAKSYSFPMQIECSKSYPSNESERNFPRATFSLSSFSNDVWDKIFPLTQDSARWYAISVAVNFADGSWDSDFGNNYSIVLNRK